MDNGFFYICLMKGNPNELKKKPDNLIISEENDEKISGILIVDRINIHFSLRLNSGLMLIKTNFIRERNKFFNLFRELFDKISLVNFVPLLSDEIKFICKKCEYESYQVFIDEKIVKSEDNNLDLCKGLKNNMELIKVSLNYNGVYFDYYGNALQFHNETPENIECVLKIFEKTMIKNE